MKKFLSLVLALTLTLGLVACGGGSEPAPAPSNDPAPSQEAPADTGIEPLTFRLGSIAGANPGYYEYDAGLYFAEKVAEYSNGAMTAEYYPASQLGNTNEQMEQTCLGTLEMFVGAGFDVVANATKVASIFGMPYVFENEDHQKAIFDAMMNNDPAVAAITQQFIDDADLRLCGISYRPFRSVLTLEKQVISPDDMAGLVIRSPESRANVEWLKGVGASPVTISWSELYTSLSTGAAQGAENNIAQFYDGAFQEIVDYAVETKHMGVSAAMICNNTWYEGLSDAQREVVDKACADFTQYTWEKYKDYEALSWKGMEDAGVVVTRWEDVPDAEWREAAAGMEQLFIEAGEFTQEQYDAVRNIKY